MSVTPTTLRKLFRWGTSVAVVAMIGAILWAAIPVPSTFTEMPTTRPSASAALKPLDPLADQTAVASAWSRSLQGRRLAAVRPNPVTSAEVPPMTNMPSASVKPTTGIRFVGTVVEPGRSRAIASDLGGRLAFPGEGDELPLSPAGITVETIENQSVWIRYEGRRMRFAVGEDLVLQRNGQSQPTAVSSRPEINHDGDGSASPATRPLRRSERMSPDEAPPMDLEQELDFLNGD